MDVDSDPRTTTENINSILDSLQRRPKIKPREPSRPRGGVPQSKYSVEEVLKTLRMSEESKEMLRETCR
eukprot:6350663-Karenia_brevis.AAC.1